MEKNTPSIGHIGMTIDPISNRIKILGDTVFDSIENVMSYLVMTTENDCAKRLMASPHARITIRVMMIKNSTPIKPFILHNIVVEEEARIETNLGFDIVYIGGNGSLRLNHNDLHLERQLAAWAATSSITPLSEPEDVTFERLCYPIAEQDAMELCQMWRRCFNDYLVPLDEALVQNAAKCSIFYVSRNRDKKIIASAIGEWLRVGQVTFLEVSEVASHPELRIPSAASGCVYRAIKEGKKTLPSPVIAFWEARMWRNILAMGPRVGLTKYAGILHQHCRIDAPPRFTSLPNNGVFGSLAVFYSQ